MTLKRYDLNTYRVWPWQEHHHGMWCWAHDVEQYVKAQRADAQREALSFVRQQMPSMEAIHAWTPEMEDLWRSIDAALARLAAGERIESVSQVGGGGE